jgi:SAM-dependent methyltransferase
MLVSLFKRLINQFSLIDLGCGDGRVLYARYSRGLLENVNRVVGVDLSEVSIKRLGEFCPFAEGIVADVCDLWQITDNSQDVAVSSKVIEHVPEN